MVWLNCTIRGPFAYVVFRVFYSVVQAWDVEVTSITQFSSRSRNMKLHCFMQCICNAWVARYPSRPFQKLVKVKTIAPFHRTLSRYICQYMFFHNSEIGSNMQGFRGELDDGLQRWALRGGARSRTTCGMNACDVD